MATPSGGNRKWEESKTEIIDDDSPFYPTPQHPSAMTTEAEAETAAETEAEAETVVSSSRIIGYGILGCAGIASKIARAIFLDANSAVTVVASRSIEKAQNFIERNCPSSDAEAMTYDELIVSDRVDVVYIPLPTALRLPWIVKAIEQRKHILCEVPIGSPKCMEVIIPSCRAKRVQFMDAMELMHHPRFVELTERIHRARLVGRIQKVVSSFSVPCTDDANVRNRPALEPLGVLGGLGIHNIRVSLWAFEYETPRFVKALCHKYSAATGALQDCSVWLFFTEDRVASFDCSYHCPLRQHAELVGSRGTVNVRQFVIPNEKRADYSIHYSTLNTYDTTETIERKEFRNQVQEQHMIARMTRIAATGRTEQFWPKVSLMTEQVLDACRRSINKDGALVEFVRGQLWF